MALGGGNWLVQNKVMPGSYINFVSVPRPFNVFGERGYSAIALELDWGADGITTVEPADMQKEALELFGYNYTAEELKPIREILMYSKTVYIGKLNAGGEKATATIGAENALTVTAKYAGTRGNAIQIAVKADVDNEGKFLVNTLVDGAKIETQTIETIEDLQENKFVSFSGAGVPEVSAGEFLKGGTNGEVTGESHANFLEELEKYYFNSVGYFGEDEAVARLYAEYIKRLRDSEGIKCQAVVYNYEANHEGIINVTSKAVEGNANFIPWVTGVSAGTAVNKSATNKLYDGEYTLADDYKQRELIEAIEKGRFMFHRVDNETRVLSDINSFTEFTVEKNGDFAQNQIIRVIDEIGMSCAKIFNKYHLGKTPNDNDGRIALWNDLVNHAQTLQQIRAIENFESEHIQIQKGVEKDSVLVDYLVQPTMAMQKMYMTVRVG